MNPEAWKSVALAVPPDSVAPLHFLLDAAVVIFHGFKFPRVRDGLHVGTFELRADSEEEEVSLVAGAGLRDALAELLPDEEDAG